MDNLHQIHTQIIVDINSAGASCEEARDSFIKNNIRESLELLDRAKREIDSARLQMKKTFEY